MTLANQETPPRTVARLKGRQALRDAMDFQRLTVRELADVCGKPSYRSTIGHLLSGSRTTCRTHLAGRIEKCLRLYPGALFELRVCSSELESSVPITAPRRRNAA